MPEGIGQTFESAYARAVVKAESTIARNKSYSSNEQTFKAKEPAPGPPAADPNFTKTQGEETLVINGKKIATKWEFICRANDPMTFTKTWTSDEAPGGLVRIQQQSHSNIAGGEYREISQTLYAPVAGVDPELGDGATPPPGHVVPPTAPGRGSTPASPTSLPPPPGAGETAAPPQPAPVPAAPTPRRGRPNPSAAPDGQAEFMKQPRL